MAGGTIVAVLTRAPSAGGKSRLFAALGIPPDPHLLSALLLDTLDALRMSGADVRVAVTPADACDEVRMLTGCSVSPQREGDLGARMRTVLEQLLAEGADAVALVGSDVPGVTPDVVRTAFEELARDPGAVVIGPAADGGYSLMAASRVPPVFDGIAWGTAHVLEQTQAAARAHGVRVHLLETLPDVDTPDDLRTWAARAPHSRTGRWASAHGLPASSTAALGRPGG
jgi:rSAM/selenodomain-associated transferase 1